MTKRSPPVRARQKKVRLTPAPPPPAVRSPAHVKGRRGPSSFKAVIRMWPTKALMASDLGVKQSRVEKWYVRDAIPAEFWVVLIQTADRGGLDLTYQDLAELAALSESESVAA